MTDKKELSIMEKLAEPLTKDDIEARIGSCFSNGFSLLLYKTARTDINRLNSVFGLHWQNKHFYDINKNLCCEISVFDKETNQWISRVDVGTESNTEREKGAYSDSFKRAGTRFGIGIELYNSPFIFVTWEMEKDQKSDKFKPNGFYASSMEITKYKSVNHQITELEIIYKGKVIYSYGSKQQKTEPKNVVHNLDDRIKNAYKYIDDAKNIESLKRLNKNLNELMADLSEAKRQDDSDKLGCYFSEAQTKVFNNAN